MTVVKGGGRSARRRVQLGGTNCELQGERGMGRRCEGGKRRGETGGERREGREVIEATARVQRGVQEMKGLRKVFERARGAAGDDLGREASRGRARRASGVADGRVDRRPRLRPGRKMGFGASAKACLASADGERGGGTNDVLGGPGRRERRRLGVVRQAAVVALPAALALKLGPALWGWKPGGRQSS